MGATTDRRTFTGSATASPFDAIHRAYVAASDALNALPKDFERTDPAAYAAIEARYTAASRALDAAPVATWGEFIRLFENAVADGGDPGEELNAKLLADARRLAETPMMGAVDLCGLDQAMTRVDQIASAVDVIAGTIGEKLDGSANMADALVGLSSTLTEQAAAIDGILQPHRVAMGVR
jgi:hypothetical protein